MTYVCGSVSRAVASDTRDPQFESSHWQTFIKHLFTVKCIEKMKIKKKEAVILKKNKDINTRTFTFGGKNAGKDSPPEPYVLRKQYTKLGRLIINRIGTMSGFTPEITYQ